MRASVSTHFQGGPQQRPPLTNNQAVGIQHRCSATMITQHGCGSVSCARAVLSGQVACGSWSVAMHISNHHHSQDHARKTVAVCKHEFWELLHVLQLGLHLSTFELRFRSFNVIPLPPPARGRASHDNTLPLRTFLRPNWTAKQNVHGRS